MWEAMQEIIESNQMTFQIGCIMLATLLCLCGYLLLKVWSTLISVGLGFAIGLTIVPRLLPNASGIMLLLVCIGCSGLLCLLTFKVEKAAIFLVGVVLGLILLRMIPFPQIDNLYLIFVAMIAAGSALIGVLAVIMEKKAIIILSVLAGSCTLVLQMGAEIVPTMNDNESKLIALIVVMAIGYLIQSVTTKD